jgi:predicted ArsR family transcriptional regulator
VLEADIETKTKRKPWTGKRVDKLRAVELKQKGASYSEIAAIQGVSPQAIQQGIKDLLPTDDLESFKQRKPDLIAHTTQRYLNLIDDEQIKKNLSQRGMTDIAILIDKEQLLRGLATSNLAVIHADIAALRAVDNSK